jgi:hypothetical protein
MAEAKTGEELDHVKNLIEDNISFGATEKLSTWSRRFNDWAEKLEPPKTASSSQGEGSNSNSGKSPMSVLKQLVALLRLREKEVILREQTRLVEQQKEKPDLYARGSSALAAQEGRSREELERISKDVPLAPLQQVFVETDQSMLGVLQMLMKPKTDDATQKEEGKTIGLLNDAINLINEQAQRQSAQQGEAASQQMAMLMQMMRQQGQPGMPMNPGNNPGYNTAGGTTDQVPPSLSLDGKSHEGDSRSVNRAGGTTENLPTEFRDALQNYFNEIERETKN